MGLELRATERVGKSESTERRTNTLLVSALVIGFGDSKKNIEYGSIILEVYIQHQISFLF